MRRYSMPEREAITKLHPTSRSDRQLLRKAGVFTGLVVLCAAAILVLNQRHRHDIEANWQSSIATIQDVRSKPVGEVESNRGGAILYDVQVLVQYSIDGAIQERWIAVQQRPVGIDEARFQALRWKGQKCFVRWKVSNPDQPIADVS